MPVELRTPVPYPHRAAGRGPGYKVILTLPSAGNIDHAGKRPEVHWTVDTTGTDYVGGTLTEGKFHPFGSPPSVQLQHTPFTSEPLGPPNAGYYSILLNMQGLATHGNAAHGEATLRLVEWQGKNTSRLRPVKRCKT